MEVEKNDKEPVQMILEIEGVDRRKGIVDKYDLGKKYDDSELDRIKKDFYKKSNVGGIVFVPRESIKKDDTITNLYPSHSPGFVGTSAERTARYIFSIDYFYQDSVGSGTGYSDLHRQSFYEKLKKFIRTSFDEGVLLIVKVPEKLDEVSRPPKKLIEDIVSEYKKKLSDESNRSKESGDLNL